MIASIKYHVAIKIAVINYTYSQWKDVPKQIGKQNAQHNPTCICIYYIFQRLTCIHKTESP